MQPGDELRMTGTSGASHLALVLAVPEPGVVRVDVHPREYTLTSSGGDAWTDHNGLVTVCLTPWNDDEVWEVANSCENKSKA